MNEPKLSDSILEKAATMEFCPEPQRGPIKDLFRQLYAICNEDERIELKAACEGARIF